MEKIKPLPPEAIDALAEAAKKLGPQNSDALFAFNALSLAGAPAIDALSDLTHSSDRAVCGQAVAALHLTSMHEHKARTVLINSFKYCPFAHAQAAIELAELGPSAIPALREGLKDDDPRIRAGAAEALGEMTRFIASVPPIELPGVLASAKPEDLAPVTNDLANTMRDRDANVRYQAAIALALIDPADRRAVPTLMEAFDGEDIVLSQRAFYPLEKMGPNAKEAVPALRKDLAANATPLIRALSAQALAAIEGDAACPALQQALARDFSEKARTGTIVAMAKASPPCPDAIPRLIGELGHKQPWAVYYLANLGERAVPALRKALVSPDLEVRKDASQALALILESGQKVPAGAGFGIPIYDRSGGPIGLRSAPVHGALPTPALKPMPESSRGPTSHN